MTKAQVLGEFPGYPSDQSWAEAHGYVRAGVKSKLEAVEHERNREQESCHNPPKTGNDSGPWDQEAAITQALPFLSSRRHLPRLVDRAGGGVYSDWVTHPRALSCGYWAGSRDRPQGRC